MSLHIIILRFSYKSGLIYHNSKFSLDACVKLVYTNIAFTKEFNVYVFRVLPFGPFISEYADIC